MSVECILDMFPKMENVYLYTITEFTHLFVDIKHMRPVTEMPVIDRTCKADIRNPLRYLLMNAVASRSVSGSFQLPLT